MKPAGKPRKNKGAWFIGGKRKAIQRKTTRESAKARGTVCTREGGRSQQKKKAKTE